MDPVFKVRMSNTYIAVNTVRPEQDNCPNVRPDTGYCPTKKGRISVHYDLFYIFRNLEHHRPKERKLLDKSYRNISPQLQQISDDNNFTKECLDH